MIITCKNCGIRFELQDDKVASYLKNGRRMPNICTLCREQKRKEKSDPYYGLEEAFSNYMPCKKRRQRVHYSPYIVGGFR